MAVPLAERLGLWAVAVGAALAVAGPAWTDIGYDGNAYAATGHGWARTGELRMAWGDTLTWWPVDGDTDQYGYSHHFPPAYPIYLGLVFKAFGYGLAQAKGAAVAMGLAMVAVVYACTRDLYGRTAGAVVAGIMAVSPFTLWVTWVGFSENLGILLFTVTMWGILRSLQREWFIVPAGAAAGLAYLSRSSMGAFFLIAGAGGFAWRLLHRGWRRTLTSVPYMLAILVFGAIVLAWAWRNVSLFGWPWWETSPGVKGLPDWVRDHPGAFWEGVAVRAPLLGAVIVIPAALLWPQARASLRRIREEHTSGLWLSVALLYVLGLFFAAAYYSLMPSGYDARRLDALRYTLAAAVPLLWALARESDFADRATLRRWASLGVVFLALSAAVMLYPAHELGNEAGRALDPYLVPGDGIEVAGSGKYALYTTLGRPQDVDVWVEGHAPAGEAEWVIAKYPVQRPGYTLLAERTEAHPLWVQKPEFVQVWARDDVVAARNVTLAPLRPGW